jgi:anti-anti-sigma factor
MANLQIAVSGGVVCIKITGPANFNSSPGFKKVANQLCVDAGHLLLLDLADCVTMDSTFLGVLASLSQRLEKPIELLNPSDRIIGLLDNLGVLDFFKVGQGENPLTANLQQADTAPAEKREMTETSLESHRLLMNINPENIPRFKDVTKYLEEDLARQNNA